MQAWKFVTYGSVALITPLTFRALSVITQKHCEDMILMGVYCCFIFAIHPCRVIGEYQCFICRFAHESCKILKHWLLFTHITLLLTGFVSEALTLNRDDGKFWFLIIWFGEILFDLLFWFAALPKPY